MIDFDIACHHTDTCQKNEFLCGKIKMWYWITLNVIPKNPLYVSSLYILYCFYFLLNLYKPSIWDNLNIYRFNIYLHCEYIFLKLASQMLRFWERKESAHKTHGYASKQNEIGNWHMIRRIQLKMRTNELWFNNLKTKWFENIFIVQIYKWNKHGEKFRNLGPPSPYLYSCTLH